MRQIVTTILFFMFVAFLSVTKTNIIYATEIKGSDYDIVSSIDTYEEDICSTFSRTKNINGVLTKACIFEQGNLSVGKYYDNERRSRVAVSFSKDNNLYPVQMHGDLFECNFFRCLYSEVWDTLINLEVVNGGYGFSPVLYKNFTKNLELVSDTTGKYLDYINPEREIMRPTSNSPGFGVDAAAIGVSNNGKWLITELKGVGIVRFNLSDGTYLRIYPDVLEHRTAPVSSSELAIDNSGKNVFHVGLNAGIGMYRIQGNCGDAKLTNEPLENPCHRDEINPDKIIWSMRYSIAPSFVENESDSVKFYAISTDPYLKYKKVHITGTGNNSSSLSLLSLGDSFTSGEGETDDKYYFPGTNTEKEKCHLSSRSYPYLIGQKLSISANLVRNVACSGAVTQDVIGHAKYQGQRNRLKDLISPTITLDSLRSEAKLYYLPGRVEQQYFVESSKPGAVIIGVGGNDSGLMSKLNECALASTCKWASDPELRSAVGKEIQSLFSKLTSVYAKIKNSSIKSQIYAIGYPQIISSVPACRNLIGTMFNQEERIFINESLAYLNKTIQRAAQNAGVKYLDIEKAFGDHILCEPTKTPAMNGIRFGEDIDVGIIGKYLGNESFHPTPYGHELIANYIKSHVSLEGATTSEREEELGKISSVPLSEYWGSDENYNLAIRHLSTINVSKDDYNYYFKDSMILQNSTVNLKIKDLESNLVISEDNITVSDDSVIEIVKSKLDNFTQNKGIYSLQIKGVSRLGELLMIYDTITLPVNVKNTPPSTPTSHEVNDNIDNTNTNTNTNTNHNNNNIVTENTNNLDKGVNNGIETKREGLFSLAQPLIKSKPFYALFGLTESASMSATSYENSSLNASVDGNKANIKEDAKNIGEVLGAHTIKQASLQKASPKKQIIKYLAFAIITVAVGYVAIRIIKNI